MSSICLNLKLCGIWVNYYFLPTSGTFVPDAFPLHGDVIIHQPIRSILEFGAGEIRQSHCLIYAVSFYTLIILFPLHLPLARPENPFPRRLCFYARSDSPPWSLAPARSPYVLSAQFMELIILFPKLSVSLTF